MGHSKLLLLYSWGAGDEVQIFYLSALNTGVVIEKYSSTVLHLLQVTLVL